MDKAQRAKYDDRAKRENGDVPFPSNNVRNDGGNGNVSAGRSHTLGERYSSQGIPFSVLEREQKDKNRRQLYVCTKIKKFIQQLSWREGTLLYTLFTFCDCLPNRIHNIYTRFDFQVLSIRKCILSWAIISFIKIMFIGQPKLRWSNTHWPKVLFVNIICFWIRVCKSSFDIWQLYARYKKKPTKYRLCCILNVNKMLFDCLTVFVWQVHCRLAMRSRPKTIRTNIIVCHHHRMQWATIVANLPMYLSA